MHSWIHKKTKGDPGTRNVRRIGTSLSRWLSELIRSLGFNTFREAGAQTRSQNEGEELGKRPCVPSVKGEWGETSLMHRAEETGQTARASGFFCLFCFDFKFKTQACVAQWTRSTKCKPPAWVENSQTKKLT